MKLSSSLQPTLIALGILLLFSCASLDRDYDSPRPYYYQDRGYYNQGFYGNYPYNYGYRNYGNGGYGQPMYGGGNGYYANPPKFHSFGGGHHHGGFGHFGGHHGHHGGFGGRR